MTTCTLYCSASSSHLSHLYTGFGLLAERDEIEVSWKADNFTPSVMGSDLKALIGDTRVAYDLRDGAEFNNANLEWSDVYFKRSYLPGGPSHVLPLGLNYAVYSKGDQAWRRLLWSLRSIRRAHPKEVAIQVVRLSKALSRATSANNGSWVCRLENYEAEPVPQPVAHVLALTRTWNPARVEGAKADEWAALNRMRAETIRALRIEFGPRFTGGLAASEDAVRNYPDCVAPEHLIKKRRYLRLMKTSDVCIATAGLRRSNGWRLAEYVAASRCIVTEELHYEVPGDFRAGANYLDFRDVDQCVSAAVALSEDPQRRQQMMSSNKRFYMEAVRPDALVSHSIARALARDI